MENLSKRSNEPLALDVREFERNERAALLTLRINSLRKQMAHTEGAQLRFLKKRTEHAVKRIAIRWQKEKEHERACCARRRFYRHSVNKKD